MSNIIHCASLDEAKAAISQGAEPIEICFGDESLLGRNGMDHHGQNSHLHPVCRQAYDRYFYQDQYGRAQLDLFAVCGEPDADAALAIYLLSRSSGFSDYPDLEPVVGVIRLVSSADVGEWANLAEEGDDGALILAWHTRRRADRDRSDMAARWVRAVKDWSDLFAARRDGTGSAEFSAAQVAEAQRIATARSANWEFPSPSDLFYGLVQSAVFGADVWYADMPSLLGYVAYVAEYQSISISLRPGSAQGKGLMALADYLNDNGNDNGWGGRPEVIGSPRGQKMTIEDAKWALVALQEEMNHQAKDA